jgi:hypothetical protein
MRTLVIACLAALAASLPAHLAGCARPVGIGADPVSTTPAFYTENKAFYLEDLQPAAEPTAPTRALKHLYEFTSREDDSTRIADGSPLSVIVSGVWVPDDLPGPRTRDLAVVLDIVTESEEPLRSLVVFYQRDVPPGQLLNFNNLLVHSTPQWDASTPPYFRLRVIDVRAERNQRTQAVLERVSNLGASLSGLAPHPVIPIVTTAIEAARLILGNQQNRVLVDYQVQFYSVEQKLASGTADLGVLKAGTWVVVGRPRQPFTPSVPRPAGPGLKRDDRTGRVVPYMPGYPAEVWREPLVLDRKTGQILRESDGLVVHAPYIAVIVSRASMEVPTFVTDRSAELVRLLSTPAGKSQPERLQAAADNLASAVRAYTARRRIQRERNIADVQILVELLGKNQGAMSAGGGRLLSEPEERELVRFLSRVLHVEGRQFATADVLLEWWNNQGGSAGRLVPDPQAPEGVRWEKP